MNERYSRQVRLSEFGSVGQHKLLEATVAIVGCGGLGAIAAAYLTGAGIGKIILIDGDRPDLSNLHRQVLYQEDDHENKAIVLKKRLASINSEISVESFPHHLSKENIDECLMGVDLVLECTDSEICKYLTNDYCHIEGIPLVYGAIYKFEGYLSFFENKNEESIHLRDIYPLPNYDIPSCSDIGVFNTIAGITGMFQANEAIKHLSEVGETLIGKMMHYNSMDNNMFKIKLKKNYRKDLVDLFEESTYEDVDCLNVPEVEVSQFLTNKKDYQIISVMSAAEHQAVDGLYKHYTNLKNIIEDWKPQNKTTLLYCRSGRVSKHYVHELMKEFPNSKIASLKGGYLQFQISNR